MPLIPGTRLGTYEIVGPLGAGGMGEVYRAKDLRLGRQVALKMLPADVASHADRLARFEREARTVAGLSHPNIVVLYSVEDDGDVRFLTMELVEGQSLDRHIPPGGTPLGRVLDLGIALSDALTAAHEKGVIHRDLKPANVMLTREGRVKVLDFGLAKLAGEASDSSPELDVTRAATMTGPVSSAGQVLGTVPYMAPEQVRGEAVDARTDLFALGILLYELASGSRPFTGATSADVSSAILRDVPKPLTSVRPDLPGELERVVSRCLEKNPRERFQTALDVCNELRRVRHAVEHGESRATPKPPSERVASIAVLPFVNRSASAEDEYFSDGLADELLNVLAKIRGLRVVARSSAFTFKGREVTVAEVGKALDVATVLEGSVRKAGNRIRVSVQLVTASDSSHLWSETYDRTLDDIFAVQDDIARSVVKELRTTLLGEEADSDASDQAMAEVALAAKGRTADPEAHRLYLQARHLNDRLTHEDSAKGIEYLKEALKLDPDFALAWAELGLAYSREADIGWAPVAEGHERARKAVEHALSLQPKLAEGHTNLGWIQMVYDWDWHGADVSMRRALELAPGNALVLRRAGVLASYEGRLEEAIGLCRQASVQDPLSASAYQNLGMALHAADRFAEAEAAYRKSLELAPLRAATRAHHSLTLVALGRGEEALAAAAREPEEWARLWALGIIHHVLGHGAESDEVLRDLTGKCAGDSACQIAEVHAARGEVAAAFEWLERAHAQRDPGLSELKPSQYFRALHDDPRWGEFLKKMGFSE